MIVFVHGVPETADLWDRVRTEIDADSIALSLPGFDAAVPDGFKATKDDYTDWVLGELEKIGEPIDLVGHDWGGGFTLRIATAYGDRVRSWVTDIANVAHPDYVWHDFAQIWQTPEKGEEMLAGMLAQPPEARAVVFEASGVPHDDAVAMASRMDQTMADCILALYRSATPNPYADWGDAMGPTAAPGLVLVPTEDPFVDEKMSREMADRLGAKVERLEGLGHWWAYQDPGAGAETLTRFWQQLG